MPNYLLAMQMLVSSKILVFAFLFSSGNYHICSSGLIQILSYSHAKSQLDYLTGGWCLFHFFLKKLLLEEVLKSEGVWNLDRVIHNMNNQNNV